MHRDLLARYQAPIIKSFALGLGGLYLVRAGIASLDRTVPHSITPVLTFSLLSLVLILGSFLTDRLPSHRLLNFVLVTAIMLVEASLSYYRYLGFVQFYFLIPLFIVYSSLFSGMVFGTITAFSSIGLGTLLVKMPMKDTTLFTPQGEHFAASYLAYITFAQLFIVVLIYFFQDYIRKNQNELHRRRIIRVRSTRKVAMADAIGKAAHELNNPIAILDGALHLLSNRPKDPAARKTMIGAMSNAEERLGSVIESIQKFTEGDLKEELTHIKVQSLVEEFQNQSVPILSRYATQLEVNNVSPQRFVKCRPNQILFILSVLLENALESSKNGQIYLRLRVHSEAQCIRFELEDRGSGISDNLTDSLFLPFQTTKAIGQTLGMNLSLCRVFLEEQGGSIGFRRLNRGTIFWFELPEAQDPYPR